MATLSSQEAARIALDTFEAKRLVKNEAFRLTAKRVKNRWAIWIEAIPEYFGGDITVFVSDDRSTEVMIGF